MRPLQFLVIYIDSRFSAKGGQAAGMTKSMFAANQTYLELEAYSFAFSRSVGSRLRDSPARESLVFYQTLCNYGYDSA
ncbi:MAG: hypothetical protein UV59_C0038G0003 [Candidatus Gottesmanbacteria bacterium GW2011_GWA1_43_11]|uniref:Uncharacterized protein n=1 Tax=Candidatus Gottesmanbacteria bacterium GW2011_GWA1_43_11 TaxID=1618436 RepID=A0A0G1F9C8_9BACT|nr:MAG: hypothetical protein UV59_C0038G0003 [Candidatus Gottesmanbacteria bacterium GW2011_GWA1_43_11]